MDKIVVRTGGSEHDKNLINCLKMLFPECEIEIQQRRPQDHASQRPVTKEADENLNGVNIDNRLNFR